MFGPKIPFPCPEWIASCQPLTNQTVANEPREVEVEVEVEHAGGSVNTLPGYAMNRPIARCVSGAPFANQPISRLVGGNPL